MENVLLCSLDLALADVSPLISDILQDLNGFCDFAKPTYEISNFFFFFLLFLLWFVQRISVWSLGGHEI